MGLTTATAQHCVALKQTVLPLLLRNHPPAQPLRIWVPGCGNGFAVYTLGIALLESLPPLETPIQLFGSDLSAAAIVAARAGIYSDETVAALSPEQRSEYFVRVQDGLQIVRRLRELCIFARHDFRADVPFTRIDLIFCPNLLASLKPDERQVVLPLFHFALCATGLLFLDSADTLSDGAQLFQQIDEEHPIHLKKPSRINSLRVNGQTPAERLAVRRQQRDPLHDILDFGNQTLLSSNDLADAENAELQSINEELETAKEELHSSNEELHSVNEELALRNEELTRTSNVLWNLLTAIPIPVLILDGDLRIRQFSPAAERVLNVRSTDIGRPLIDMSLNLEHSQPGIELMLREVLEAGQGRDRELRDAFGRWHVLRARPYRTAHNAIDGVLVMLVDVDQIQRSRQQTEQALDRSRAELRALTASLIKTQEEERRRVSRELHDDLGQKVALISLQAARLQQLGSDPATLAIELAELRRQTSQLTEDLRRISFALHPSILEDLGLHFALKKLVEEFALREDMPARFSCAKLPPYIPQATASALYRITQEALRNIAKHAGKTRVLVSLRGTPGQLRLQIRDHGNGIAPNAVRGTGMGIMSMEERAHLIGGRFTIKKPTGRGVEITVEVPLAARPAKISSASASLEKI